MSKITTSNGQVVPPVGLGTFPLQGQLMAETIWKSVNIGYRLIDTADDYRGESGIGLAIDKLHEKTGLRRADVFLQTKISQDNAHADEPLEGIWFNPFSKYQARHTVEEVVKEKIYISIREMKTDYLDSVLIHYPFPGYYEEIWYCLMNLQKEGIIRYIGVSNFHVKEIEALKKIGKTPDINEIYVSPLGTKNDDVNYAQKNDIQIMSYSPLMDLATKRLSSDVLNQLASKYNKSKAQIIIRWNIERQCIPLPRTKNYNRLVENFDVLDFSLTQNEVDELSALNIDNQFLIESKQCPGL